MPNHSAPSALLDAACLPYRKVGRFAYHFARGKLGKDPVFRAMLDHGWLTGCDRLLDLGCGQGLLTSWLRAARDAGLTALPRSIVGIELMTADVRRAHAALGASCGVSQGDIRTAPFGSVDAVVILDVMHYMHDAAQREVLARVRAALPERGILLLRVGDAGGGLRFRYSQWVDQTIMLLRGHSWVRTHCRPIAAWQRLLEELSFEVRAVPMSEGTPFANVLLIARAVTAAASVPGRNAPGLSLPDPP